MPKNESEVKSGIIDYLSSCRNGLKADSYARMTRRPPEDIYRMLCGLVAEGNAVERNGEFFKKVPADRDGTKTANDAAVPFGKDVPTDRGSRHRRILNYLFENPAGTTVKQYADVTGVSYNMAVGDFSLLKTRNQIVRCYGKYVHPAHISSAENSRKPVPVKTFQNTKEKTPPVPDSNNKNEIPAGKLRKIRNYLGTGRRTTLRDLMDRFDITQEDIAYMKNSGFLKSRDPSSQ